MNLKQIQEMINLMNENGLTELEMEKDGLKIRLKKGSSRDSSPDIYLSESKVSSGGEAKAAEAPAQVLIEIKAPMVGTFYRSSSPEAGPFIEAGSTVNKGQVVCIIEAMKLMNEIKSEVTGKVKDILVDNGDPVEFGQILILLEPA
ncbi:MAG: acetyl-CoA carboxylase, biotin carboxyl carrier protein [Candidatus Omnitrophica bacterium CG1_02_49_10]|nr:MAG: acetyl-CoA carboxylase, biotin carboxyl carrier protein [Candidatus Omnitrophica bacterium CG1_02_49_10]